MPFPAELSVEPPVVLAAEAPAATGLSQRSISRAERRRQRNAGEGVEPPLASQI